MIIRSDRLRIKADTPLQREALDETLRLYRRLVRDLMTVVFTHWPKIGSCEDDKLLGVIEELIHPTRKRPSVRYQYFARRYYKFPSYLRRVAVRDAVGQVRSFMTRYRDWGAGKRRGRRQRPPRLQVSTNTFPSLYSGQCIKINSDASAAFIKVRSRGDWIWIQYRLQGRCRYRGRGKAKSPLLTFDGRHYRLSLPEAFQPKRPTKTPRRVLAIDVGINTTATCAVVNANGTVDARASIKRSNTDREQRLMQRIEHAARRHTRHGSRLPPGFAARDHRRLRRMADNAAHQISRRLINMALAQGCEAVVAEDLKGWRPKAGRRRSTMKARFHRWFHRMLVERICSKAEEAGLRVTLVHPRGTSRQAFDGSGPVKRDPHRYSLCTFPTGKRYNADLNAAYNIAARGIVYFQGRGGDASAHATQPMSRRTSGSPVTLSTLWQQSQAVGE